MKLHLYYIVRKYTNPDSIKAFGELVYKSGPYKSWIEADCELDSMIHPEGYVIVSQVIDVKEEYNV